MPIVGPLLEIKFIIFIFILLLLTVNDQMCVCVDAGHHTILSTIDVIPTYSVLAVTLRYVLYCFFTITGTESHPPPLLPKNYRPRSGLI